MSLLCLTCSCHDIDTLIRRALKNGGDPEWLSRPIYRGKDSSLSALGFFTRGQELNFASVLRDYIYGHSRYAIIVGISDDAFVWTDLTKGREQEWDAEVIVEQFS